MDGIRDDAYVNSVREDPNREGLLYAGTNHGVYVTLRRRRLLARALGRPHDGPRRAAGEVPGAPHGGRPHGDDRAGGAAQPWIADVTDEDLVEQYEFGVRIRDQVDRANRAAIEIRRVKAELEERLEGVEDARLPKAAERLRVALEKIEG